MAQEKIVFSIVKVSDAVVEIIGTIYPYGQLI